MKSTFTVSEEIRTNSTSLLLVFVILKLTSVIDWPWIWVLAPFWIPIILAVVVISITVARTRR